MTDRTSNPVSTLNEWARNWLTQLRRESGGYPAEVLRHINALEAETRQLRDENGKMAIGLGAVIERERIAPSETSSLRPVVECKGCRKTFTTHQEGIAHVMCCEGSPEEPT